MIRNKRNISYIMHIYLIFVFSNKNLNFENILDFIIRIVRFCFYRII